MTLRRGRLPSTHRPLPSGIVVGVLLLAALGSRLPAQSPAPPPAAADTATLKVTIAWDGDLPDRRAFEIPADFRARSPEEAAYCGECATRGTLRHEDLEVDPKSRGVRNVAVSLAGVKGDPSGLPAATVDNRECRFEPHVQFVAVGRALTVKNSDAFAHNARIVGRGRQEFWNAIVGPGKAADTRPFVVSGTYSVVCDVHPWMSAVVIAVKHPFCAVSGIDGSAVIAGIPPGADREVVLWHETLGVARLKLDLERGATAERAVNQKAFQKG